LRLAAIKDVHSIHVASYGCKIVARQILKAFTHPV
jgi:hypothetical protein